MSLGIRMRIGSTRRWSDWVGMAVFTAIGANLYARSPEFGLLVLPALLQELIVAVSFLLRPRERLAAPGLLPRVVAYLNSFGVMLFLWYAARYQPAWIRPTSAPVLRTAGGMLWLSGAVLSLWPLWHLRRNFSVEPEARDLVTTGPYRWARHPIYAVYLLINCGILLRHPTFPLAAVLAGWLGLLLLRAGYEEQVLVTAFPQYREYRRRVGAFGPRLARPALTRQIER
jgi:protein-S-isoprenylcysteine O-methyltransferase Ste14